MKKTDRDLLLWAAKAAAIDVFWWPADDPVALRLKRNNDLWNPLTDDGDAQRLAVKLKIGVAHTNIHSPQVHALADPKVQEWEDSSSDPLAATRRAIVRAAAEIGRNMK